MFDVVAIGELLIDFTPNGVNDQGVALFGRNPGGAPANVLAMNSRLGGKSAFIGKVGQDDFGRFLQQTLRENEIDTSGLVMSPNVNTTLAFVQLNDQGDRSFSFYRKPSADMMLTADEVNEELIKACSIFHYGSVSLTDDPCRTATIHAVRKAKEMGKMISYDPNYRPLLWQDEALAKAEILSAMQYADIVKVSEEELEFLTGEKSLAKGAEQLAHHGAALIIVTLGAEGSFFYNKLGYGHVSTCQVKAIDTTGAGDAFFGTILYRLKGLTLEEIAQLSQQQLEEILYFANTAGSLTTERMGAIPAMPTLKQIEERLLRP